MTGGENRVRGLLFPQLYGEGRYLFLLVSLLLLFFFYPFFDGLRFAPRILGALFLIILVSSVSSVSSSRGSVAAASFLAALSLMGLVINQFTDNLIILVLTTSAFILFFALITVVVLGHILSRKEVTVDTILGSICAYLLLGMVWAMVYTLIEVLVPFSFSYGGESIAAGFAGPRGPVIPNFIYYSFVTLTTLGYGDITPNSSPAAALSSLEAVTGQLFIAVLIARLVGLHIASASIKSRD